MTDGAQPAPTTGHRLYEHVPHPHIAERRVRGPAKTSDQATSVNARIALRITAVVGTMLAAYAFTALALISLPAAISSHDLIIIVAWVAQTFLQLVLLPIIMVGQNVQGKAADQRAADTYKDAEAILQECLQLQAHLQGQDAVLSSLMERLEKVGSGPS